MTENGPAGITPVNQSLWQRLFTSLHYRDYRLIWLGSCTEHIGEFMEVGALLWLVNELTGSPFMLTVVGSCRFVPMIFFSFIGGVVSDRVNRKNLLLITLLAQAFVSAALGILVWTGLVTITHLIVVSLLSAVLTSFNHPARASIVPNLVKREQLLNAISLDTASVMAARFVGMPIAGILISVAGVTPVFFLRVAGALIAMFWLSWVHVPPTPPEARKRNPWKNLVEGLRYVCGYGIVLTLVILYIIPQFAGQTSTNFLPIFAQKVYMVGAAGYGYLQAVPGLGSVLALIVLASLGSPRHKGLLMFTSGIILGLALMAFGVMPWFIPSLLILIVVGGMTTAFMALGTTIIQTIIPDEVRGRVMSLREIFFGLGPAFSLIFGLMAEGTGVQLATVALGMVCFLIPIALMLALPTVRRLD